MSRVASLPSVSQEASDYQRKVASAEIVFGLILGQIPHLFGKLVWMSSFRVTGSTEYRSCPFGNAVTPEIASEAISHAHMRLFTQWLGLSLEEQYKDLAQYLSSGESAEQILKRGFGLENLIPGAATEAERLLFVSDLEMIVGLMQLV